MYSTFTSYVVTDPSIQRRLDHNEADVHMQKHQRSPTYIYLILRIGLQ